MVFRGILGVTLGSPTVEPLVASHSWTSVAPKVNFSGGRPWAASIPTGETRCAAGTAFGDGLVHDGFSGEVLNSSSQHWSNYPRYCCYLNGDYEAFLQAYQGNKHKQVKGKPILQVSMSGECMTKWKVVNEKSGRDSGQF